MKTERTQIHFLSDVLVAVASLVILMTRHYPDLGDAFDWLKQRGATNFSARFKGKPVVASLNVRCLLRPDEVPSPCRNPEESFWYTQAVPTSS